MSETHARAVAKQFWEGSEVYPEYGTIQKRRLFELNYLVPRLEGRALLDLGCGDGALLSCLLRLTSFEKYYGFDLSPALLKHVDPAVETHVYDCYNPGPLPQVDVTIFGGVIPFLFEDEVIDRVFERITSPVVFVRTTCTLKPEDEYIDTYSEKLQSDYAARYPTVSHMIALMNKQFTVTEVNRVYPDEIESEFGTKQFYFKGVRS